MGEENINYYLYDQVISTTLVNLMIEENRNKGLRFTGFDPENANHKYMFEIIYLFLVSVNNNGHDKKVVLEMGLFDYLKFKLKNWTIKDYFKRYTKKDSEIAPLEVEKMLEYMKEQLKLEENTYNDIYETYYKTGAEHRGIYRRKRKK